MYQSIWGRTKALVSVLLLSVAAACGSSSTPPASATTNNVNSVETTSSDERDCLWALNSSINTLFPDTHATYWVAAVVIPPGGAIRLDGAYPHARYLSYNTYNPLLQPLDGLNDTEIMPLPGSTSPFARGADRNAVARAYSVRVVAKVPPDDATQRLPNTIYSAQAVGPTSVPTNLAVLFYRVYVPDGDRDSTGGVGLPRIRFELADGSVQSGPVVCSALDTLSFAIPNLASIPGLLTGLPLNTSAFQHPLWLKFFDLQSLLVSRVYATPLGPVVYEQVGSPTNGAGGLASNRDNRYITAAISQQLGPVVALRPKMPRIPRTAGGESPMQDGDLRYWSLCSNNADTLAVIDCLYDEQIVRDAQDRAVIVVSRAADRPANAVEDCGVSWLDWGSPNSNQLILRNMLAKPEIVFPQAIQYVPGPPGLHEAEVMQDYYPYGVHLSKAAFEAYGCPVSANALPTEVTPPP